MSDTETERPGTAEAWIAAIVPLLNARMRTQLSTVHSMAEVLERSAVDEESRVGLATVRQASTSLLAFLDDLSAVTGAHDAHAPHVAREQTVWIDDVIDAACLAWMEPAERKGVSLEWEIEPADPPAFRGDSARIAHAVSHLVSNAVQYTERGQVTVRARLEVDPSGDAGVLTLRVTDTGPGVPSWQQATLFTPFWQRPETGVARPGIGLALCKKVFREAGGEIALESTGETGSVFRVTLPVAIVREARASEASREPAPAWSARPRVLVVDDDDANRFVAMRMLEVIGCQPAGAANGSEALEKMMSESFHAVLMDFFMPRLSGLDVTRQYRVLEPPGRRVPIIAMTANAMPTDRELGIAAGMDDYLAKPISIDKLAEMLRHHVPLTRATMRPTAVPPPMAVEPETLDLSTLIELASYETPGDARGVRHLCDVFLSDMTERLRTLRGAIARSDTDTIAHEAHAVRGASANFGAHRLASLADRLERSAGLSSHAHQTLALELELERDRMGKQIEAWLASREGNDRRDVTED